METIPLFDAISQMRKLTSEGRPFSFTHATYNRESMSSDGIRHVRHAKLRPAAKEDQVVNADHKLFYYDLDQQMPRVAWQLLIMFFNGKKIEL